MTSVFMHDIQHLWLGPVEKQDIGSYVRTLTIESRTETNICLNLFSDNLAALEVVQSPPDKEFAWLIEAGDPPHYWAGRTPSQYTTDPNEAVRFARFEDAERVRLNLVVGGVHWKSVQHGFIRSGRETRDDLSVRQETAAGEPVNPYPKPPPLSPLAGDAK